MEPSLPVNSTLDQLRIRNDLEDDAGDLGINVLAFCQTYGNALDGHMLQLRLVVDQNPSYASSVRR